MRIFNFFTRVRLSTYLCMCLQDWSLRNFLKVRGECVENLWIKPRLPIPNAALLPTDCMHLFLRIFSTTSFHELHVCFSTVFIYKVSRLTLFFWKMFLVLNSGVLLLLFCFLGTYYHWNKFSLTVYGSLHTATLVMETKTASMLSSILTH